MLKEEPDLPKAAVLERSLLRDVPVSETRKQGHLGSSLDWGTMLGEILHSL